MLVSCAARRGDPNVTLGVTKAPPVSAPQAPQAQVPKWSVFERAFESAVAYNNPLQQTTLRVTFTSPLGDKREVEGFWDGEQTWRVRFSPNQMGRWNYATVCSDTTNNGLHEQSGSFLCTPSYGLTRFDLHGPVRLSRDGHYLMHEDLTPFFWLGDTAWSGPLLARPEDWLLYLRERQRQKFSVVQWVATQFRAAPHGDRLHQLPYSGKEKITINPTFFQELDIKVTDIDRSGFLSAPVLLWAIAGGSDPSVNPGVSLPEDQAILLARYMIARWGANNIVWVLGGDGDYRGEKADKWKRIGRALFAEREHAPVVLHPGGMHWNLNEFQDEKWLNIIGYQSGHGDDNQTLQWIFNGPPAKDWKKEPPRPFINLEPPYENHIAYQSQKRHTPESVRRAIYWSLLVAPTAGVTYGGHGVWGWDDGTKPPVDHPSTGIPMPWRLALTMPGAEQMAHVSDLFNSIEFWRLRPAPEILVVQPGTGTPARHIAAARSEKGDLSVIYVPNERNIKVKSNAIPSSPDLTWFNPRTGETAAPVGVVANDAVEFATPGEGDWVLVMKGKA
jgi:hypothetical protein